MSSQLKPVKVWGKGGPNPSKVAIVLRELGVPYEEVAISFADVKKADYLAINPNGRMPTIQDPNTGLTLWESGAIVEYLVERYDAEHRRLSFAPGTPESYHAKQWLYFQATGQGPYFGQAVWFKKFHPERLPSALERYVKEVHRVAAVLEGHLAKQQKEKKTEDSAGGGGRDGPWLVGGKMSYADIAFLPWQVMIGRRLDADEYREEDYPHVKRWLDSMRAREAVKAVMDDAAH